MYCINNGNIKKTDFAVRKIRFLLAIMHGAYTDNAVKIGSTILLR